LDRSPPSYQSIQPRTSNVRSISFFGERKRRRRERTHWPSASLLSSGEAPQRLDELRERMEEHVSTELTAALAEYRPARIIGTVFVATGLALATAANFIA
jgi:hypothetical protein